MLSPICLSETQLPVVEASRPGYSLSGGVSVAAKYCYGLIVNPFTDDRDSTVCLGTFCNYTG